MATSDPTEVWLRPDGSAAGPKPQHSRRSIAVAAMHLADDGGVTAVSMRKVAAEMGAGTASLYRYLKSHDELLEVMMDLAAEEYELAESTGPGTSAFTELARLAFQGRAIMHRHPWLPPLLLTRPGMGPASLAYLEHALRLMNGLDMDGSDKLQTVAMLTAITSAFVQNELAQATLIGANAPQPPQFLLAALTKGSYPHLGEALAGSNPPRNADEGFAAVIRRHLIGAGLPDAGCREPRLIGSGQSDPRPPGRRKGPTIGTEAGKQPA